MEQKAASNGTLSAGVPSPLEDYLFDLRGYLVLEQALEPGLVDDLNSALDGMPPIEPRGWWGNVQRSGSDGDTQGLEFHNLVEGGKPFERLIDHPSWINHVRRYAGESDSYVEGLFILMALTDIGPGDGATMIIPGSHKSRLEHPDFGRYEHGPMDAMEGVAEAHLKRGDALLFCDGLSHGCELAHQSRGASGDHLPLRPVVGFHPFRLPVLRRAAGARFAGATQDPAADSATASHQLKPGGQRRGRCLAEIDLMISS